MEGVNDYVGGRGKAGNKSTTARRCTYKNGVCDIHGRGAVRKWRPSFITEVGPGGVKTRRYVKKYEYVCDLGEAGGKLNQSRLPFSAMTVNDRKGGATDIAARGEEEGSDLGASKEGQISNCVRIEGMGMPEAKTTD